MFSGKVDSVSHEGGLLLSYSGSCPALGSVIVDSRNEYVGKVDGVIGNMKNSMVHVSHLDRKSRADSYIGVEVQIRSKREVQNKKFERRSNHRRDGRSDRRDGRSDRRGGRSDRRGDRDSRNRNKQQNSGNRDWTCNECGNSNFSFRTECNRCQKPKGSRGNQNKRSNRDSRDRREMPRRAGDWDCSSCNKTNFARNNECFNCGKSKRVGGPKQRGHYRKRKDPPGLHSAKYGRRRSRD